MLAIRAVLRHRRRTVAAALFSASSATAGDFARGDGAVAGGGVGCAYRSPVVIVGAGPVGLVLAFLLAKFGINCTVLEKNTAFSQHPQAHFINNRSMEIFRKLDGLAGDIESFQPNVDLWRKFIYCTSLSGRILGSVDHMKPEDFKRTISPTSVAHFSQYKLVNLLCEKLRSIGVRICYPDGNEINNLSRSSKLENKILMGHECTSVQLTDEGLTVGARYYNGVTYEEKHFNCRFLVGSDGARSTVRNLVGIGIKGERDLQKLISVHFRSRDLGKYLLNERPGMLFFIFNADAIGVLVAHDLPNGEFVLQMPYYPPQQDFQDFDHKICEQLIFNLVGWEPADVQVLDIKPWVMHAEVAENYVSCNRHVILAGDAAHRFPPAGGFGMNTGIQDVHNLAWKLSYVLKGIASPSLISTYESERRPVAIFNTQLSVENFKAAMSVPSALGLNPAVANTVHRVIGENLGSFMPRSLQKAVLESMFSIGRVQVADFILNERNPIGSLRLERLRSIFDEGKSLQLQFPAEDLGFCYQEGALIGTPDGADSQQVAWSESVKRSSREYIPSSKPGSRLPHMEVRMLASSSPMKEVISTLDLVCGDKPEFILIIAPIEASYDLARAFLEVASRLEVPFKLCVMWSQALSSEDKVAIGSRTKLEPWKNYVDVEETREPSWWELCSMTTNGILLVRPDEHIAWRAESNTIEDPASEAASVFSKLLCLERIV